MKETIDPTPLQPEEENFANRKLIRPAFNRTDHNHGNHNHISNHIQAVERRDRSERHERPERGFDRSRKAIPAEQTNAENFYYQKQMQTRTPMVIVLQDGEELHGVIEWYDKHCIKLTRESGHPNLMIYKPAIKYMFKEDEGR